MSLETQGPQDAALARWWSTIQIVIIIQHFIVAVHVIQATLVRDGQVGVAGDASGLQVLDDVLGYLKVTQQGGCTASNLRSDMMGRTTEQL